MKSSERWRKRQKIICWAAVSLAAAAGFLYLFWPRIHYEGVLLIWVPPGAGGHVRLIANPDLGFVRSQFEEHRERGGIPVKNLGDEAYWLPYSLRDYLPRDHLKSLQGLFHEKEMGTEKDWAFLHIRLENATLVLDGTDLSEEERSDIESYAVQLVRLIQRTSSGSEVESWMIPFPGVEVSEKPLPGSEPEVLSYSEITRIGMWLGQPPGDFLREKLEELRDWPHS